MKILTESPGRIIHPRSTISTLALDFKKGLSADDTVFLDSLENYYLYEPVEFVKDVIGAEPDDWQADVLLALTEYKQVAVASCTGAGKTALAAWAIIWFLMTRPDALIPCSAPSQPHLSAVLWPMLHEWIRKSESVDFLLMWEATHVRHRANPHEAFAVQRTATAKSSVDTRNAITGEKQVVGAAGLHRDHMLIVIDEASGVDVPNFETFEATTTGYENRMLAIGNPIYTHGTFFDIWFHAQVAKSWRKFRISAIDHKEVQISDTGKRYIAPHASEEKALQMIREYGEQSVVVQAKVFGNHPLQQSDDVELTYGEVNDAMERVVCEACGRHDEEIFSLGDVPDFSCPEHIADETQIGHDSARYGGDEAPFYVRKGLRIVQWGFLPKSSTTRLAEVLIHLMTRWTSKGNMLEYKHQPMVCVDEAEAGGGGSLVDIMWSRGYFNVFGVHFGGTSSSPNLYKNIASELWLGEMRRVMPWLQLPRDTKLMNQLITRPYRHEETVKATRRYILPKPQMKRMGLASPDRGDALTLAVYRPSSGGVY